MPYSRFHWTRTVDHLRRYRHIVGVLIKYGFDEVVQVLRLRVRLKLGLRLPARPQPAPPGRTRPQALRMALEELGPTFIKLGQLLSTRPDVLPADYIRQLEQLQDQVAPVEFEKVRQDLQKRLGAGLEEFFSRFDPVPLAAGSIAIVYRARTREGDEVAVKVLRPGVEGVLRTECEILQDLAGLIKSGLARDQTIDPVQMAREFTAAVTKEVDLANELRNLQRFGRNFADDPTVHVAKAYPPYCRPGVLTMELIQGVKPTDRGAVAAAGLDPKVIARNGANFVLRQIFEFGLFHTDPHPGNLLVLPGNVLAPLDFGQIAHLGSADRALLGELVLAVVEGDADRLLRVFARSGMLSEGTRTRDLARDLEEALDVYHSLPLGEIPFGQMLSGTFDIIRRHRVRPPAEFVMMLKSMMTIESLGTALDADFRLIKHLRPYARRLTLRQYSPLRLWRRTRLALDDAAALADRLPEDLSAILGKFKRGQFQLHLHHEHLESLIHILDRTSNRVSFALIIAGLVVGSSLLVPQPGTVLGLVSLQTLGVLGYLTAAILGLWLLASIIRGRHL
jgi:ubiquinone biosynthesis protein